MTPSAAHARNKGRDSSVFDQANRAANALIALCGNIHRQINGRLGRAEGGKGDELRALLRAGCTKEVEDKTDAFFCALIGYHHWLHAGRRSEVIGDLETGFILLPAAAR